MQNGDKQEEEIKTIRDRKIEIKLSDADVVRLGIVAGEAGLMPSELLANFIGDLVDGTYSNGSDERFMLDSGTIDAGSEGIRIHIIFFRAL